VFFLIAGAGTAYLSHAVVNFFHLVFLYGTKEVLSHNLHFIYKRITITVVSNRDHLSSTHSICNFVAVSVTWFYMLGLTHLVVFKIFKRLAPDFFDKFYKKIYIP